MQRKTANLLLITLLPFCSGAAALSHELLWTRRLIDVMGATDFVTGRVLGLFFLGISLGSYLATFFLRFRCSAISLLLIAELLVALLALPAVFLPDWTNWIWSELGTEMLVSWQGSVLKLILASVVVLPPSIAMGCTLPFFIRAATESGFEFNSTGIWIYAINTIGGVCGLWLTSTYLLQCFGAMQAMLAVSALNVIVALLILTLRESRRAFKGNAANQGFNWARENAPPRPSWKLIALAFFSGFVVLAFEVLLFRLIALVVPSSYMTTSALLAIVILVLGVSSLAISFLNYFKSKSKLRLANWLLIIGFAMSTVLISVCPAILFESTDKLVSIRYLQGLNGSLIESVSHYWVLVFCLAGMTGGSALLFCGFVFPSLMTISSQKDASGTQLGALLAANGIGGLVGSEFFNNWLIGMVGIYQGFSVLALFTLIASVVLLFQIRRMFSLALLIALIGVVTWGINHNSSLPYSSPRSKTQFSVMETCFGPEGVLLVVEDPDKSQSILVNNQYVLGSSGATDDQRRQLLLPWLFNREAKSICCLGLATGISASGLEQVNNPPSVTAIELSAKVEKIAKTYFADHTNGFFNRQENHVIIEDARIYMAASDRDFDIIVGDLYRPHGTGEGRLYSVEHFRNVRRALNEDGLFCQWLPIYQLNEENFLTIAASFQNAFSDTLVVYGNTNDRFPVIGLIGRKSDVPWRLGELKQASTLPIGIAELDPQLKTMSKLIVGRLKKDALKGIKVNTLDNLAIEIGAGNFWILKDLRRHRKISYQTEFLSGKNLIEFKDRLNTLVEPVRH